MIREQEKETDDVYKILQTKNSTGELHGFITDLGIQYDDNSFAEYFKPFFEQFTGNRPELARISMIDTSYLYKILNAERKPNREKAIALCLAVGMTDTECNRCLKRCHYGILYAKDKRDAVIIYAFRNKLSVLELNEKLEKFDLRPLELSKE